MSTKPPPTKRHLLAIEGVDVSRPVRSGTTRNSLCFDPERALEHLRSADRELGRSIDSIGPFAMEVRGAASTFAALAEAIVHQQLSTQAARTIHTRFRALFARSDRPSATELLAISEADLRAVGLSRAKAAAIIDLGERCRAGLVPTLARARRMSDDEVVHELSAVRGVGRWTAEMFLIFRLGRPDVLPLGDYGVRRGFGLVFGDGDVATPTEMAERAERWRPYRTAASWYLWRAADSKPL